MQTTARVAKRKKQSPASVQWGSVTVREFPVVLGDNPSICGGGAPLTIGWKPKRKTVTPLDQYEYYRGNVQPRRGRRDLRLSSGDRNSLLLERGYSLNELIEATAEADQIRASRLANIKASGRFDSFRKVLVKNTMRGNNGMQKSPSFLALLSSSNSAISAAAASLGKENHNSNFSNSTTHHQSNKRGRVFMRSASESQLNVNGLAGSKSLRSSATTPSTQQQQHHQHLTSSLRARPRASFTRQPSEARLLARALMEGQSLESALMEGRSSLRASPRQSFLLKQKSLSRMMAAQSA